MLRFSLILTFVLLPPSLHTSEEKLGGPHPANPNQAALILSEDGADCDVASILGSQCGNCHSSDRALAALDLTSPGLAARLVDRPSMTCAGWKLVTPGEPEHSFLYEKVAADQPSCGGIMPPDHGLEPDAQLCLRNYIVSLTVQ